MAKIWCSEMAFQDLTVLASSRNTKINRTSLFFTAELVAELDSTAGVGQDFVS